MRTIFLLTGFQNWGKTYLIKEVFDKSRFESHVLHRCKQRRFCVVPQSNDDLGRGGFEKSIDRKFAALAKAKRQADFIVAAFCPTKESNNNSFEIIQQKFQGYRVVIVPIEYKWCGHAKLQIEELIKYYSVLPNVEFAPLSAIDTAQKIDDLKEILCGF